MFWTINPAKLRVMYEYITSLVLSPLSSGLCRSLDFTSVNNFQEEVKFSSPSLYNLTPPPPPSSRPPPYEMSTNFSSTLGKPQPLENYYAATDIIKVSLNTLGRFLAEVLWCWYLCQERCIHVFERILNVKIRICMFVCVFMSYLNSGFQIICWIEK